MRHPEWNSSENANYDRLSNPSGGATMSAVEGLAYTAVMEMYHARMEGVRHEEEKKRLRDAMGMIAEGICEFERILGVSIEKIAAQNFQKRLDMLRQEGAAK